MRNIYLTLLAILVSLLGMAQTYFDDQEGDAFNIYTSSDEKFTANAATNINSEKTSAKISVFGYPKKKKYEYIQPNDRFYSFKGSPIYINDNSIKREKNAYSENQLMLGGKIQGKLENGIAEMISKGKPSGGFNVGGLLGGRYTRFKQPVPDTSYQYVIHNNGAAKCIKYNATDPCCCDSFEVKLVADSVKTSITSTRYVETSSFMYYLGFNYEFRQLQFFYSDASFANQIKDDVGYNGFVGSINLLGARYFHPFVNPSKYSLLLYGMSSQLGSTHNYSELDQVEVRNINSISVDTSGIIRTVTDYEDDGYIYAKGIYKSGFKSNLVFHISYIPNMLGNRVAFLLYGKYIHNTIATEKNRGDLGFQVQLVDKKNPLTALAGIFVELQKIGKKKYDADGNKLHNLISFGINASFSLFAQKTN